MTWRIAVRHRTGYHYSSAVRASYNEARMTPTSNRGQQTLESRLDITPAARPLRYLDYWGTAVDAFDEDFDVAVGQLEALHHVGHAAHREDVLGAWIVYGRVVLGGQEDSLVLGQRMLQRANGRRPSNHERHHHVREDDVVSERDDWQRFVDFDHSYTFGMLSNFSSQLSALSADS